MMKGETPGATAVCREHDCTTGHYEVNPALAARLGGNSRLDQGLPRGDGLLALGAC
jgi:hypothetical protein